MSIVLASVWKFSLGLFRRKVRIVVLKQNLYMLQIISFTVEMKMYQYQFWQWWIVLGFKFLVCVSHYLTFASIICRVF